MARWIKPGININFVGSFKRFGTFSLILILGSFGMFVFNWIVRGQPLNYGTDFKGGSEIQVEFSKPVTTAKIRGTLEKAGFKGAEVVKVAGSSRPNFYMLRISEVSAFSEADQTRVKSALQSVVKKENLESFDYKTGSDKVYLNFKRGFEVDPDKVEQVFKKSKVGVQQVQKFGRTEDNVFEVTLVGLEHEVRRIFETSLGAGIVKDIPQVESVGAKMGKQLRDDGIKSVLYALILMLIYIAFRFDFHYAPGAVVALTHDLIITTGVFALTYQEFSLNVLAALLTLAGYSINDTIVVFDRIRENVAKLRDRKFSLVVNTAVNETLSRTLLTSVTTLFTCVAIWLGGTGVLKPFGFTLTFGIIIGTYSSIYIASPTAIWLKEKIDKAKSRATA